MSFQEKVRTDIAAASAKAGALNTVLAASKTWDPPATAASQGAEVNTTLTVTGAAVGDPVVCGHTAFDGSQLCDMECMVSAANTVKVRVINNTAAAVDIPSGTLKVIVFK